MAIPEHDLHRASAEQARHIEADMGLDLLLRKLYELPQEIRLQQEAVAAVKVEVDRLRGELETEEAILIAEISQETGANGKPLFSNDTARRAELRKRMSTSAEYQRLAKELAEAEAAHERARFDLDLKVNEFSAVRHACSLQAQRLAIMAPAVRFAAEPIQVPVTFRPAHLQVIQGGAPIGS